MSGRKMFKDLIIRKEIKKKKIKQMIMTCKTCKKNYMAFNYLGYRPVDKQPCPYCEKGIKKGEIVIKRLKRKI
jgi:hypothetical protein